MASKKEASASKAKATTPKAKAAPANGDFSIKQVGQNIIIVKDNTIYSRRFADKDEREHVKQLAASYSFKPTQKLFKEIISIMNADKVERVKEVQEVKETKKGKSKAVTKPAEEKLQTTDEQIAAAKKLLEDNNYNVSARQATISYRGEY